MKDPYKVLGVSKSSSSVEIKNAYRKLVKEYHPDKNPGSENAEEMMKMFNESYEILADPIKRRQYDESGEAEASPAEHRTGNSSFSLFNIFHFFDELLGRIKISGYLAISLAFIIILGSVYFPMKYAYRRIYPLWREMKTIEKKLEHKPQMFKEYFPNGNIKRVDEYNEMGSSVLSKIYYPDGKVKEIIGWSHSRITKHEKYDEKGRQIAADDNSPQQQLEEYDLPNGFKRVDDYEGLTSKVYSKDGQVHEEWHYDGVNRQGRFSNVISYKAYYDNGQFRQVHENMMNGSEFKEYYPTGVLKELVVYSKQKLIKRQQFAESGLMTSEDLVAGDRITTKTYENNNVKEIIFRNSKGEIMSREKYNSEGNLIPEGSTYNR